MKVVRYEPPYKDIWDDFVPRSKNGLFLFYRNYMDYHADRFKDHSLIFYNNDKFVALMPSSENENELVSHGGLTFGGIISDRLMKTSLMMDIFEALIVYLKKNRIQKLIYKAIPHIYHTLPAEEDLYALFIHKAKLIRRDVASTVEIQDRLRFSKGRKHSIAKAKKAKLSVKQNDDFETFMAIEKFVLKKYHNVEPVHSADEIKMLAKAFPENIKLFSAFDKDKMLAGVVIYENKYAVHAQYISSKDEGKTVGASDIILDYLINDYYSDKKYFDFGISTENDGLYLNTGLVANKEGFGARTTVYDFYELNI